MYPLLLLVEADSGPCHTQGRRVSASATPAGMGGSSKHCRHEMHLSLRLLAVQVILNHVVPEDLSGGQLRTELKHSPSNSVEIPSLLGTSLTVKQDGSGDIFITPKGTNMMSKVCTCTAFFKPVLCSGYEFIPLLFQRRSCTAAACN